MFKKFRARHLHWCYTEIEIEFVIPELPLVQLSNGRIRTFNNTTTK